MVCVCVCVCVRARVCVGGGSVQVALVCNFELARAKSRTNGGEVR